MKVLWFSAGCSSFVAGMLAKPDLAIYIHIDDQHADTMRFVEDCAKLLPCKMEIMQSPYRNVEDVYRSLGRFNPRWSVCTDILKRRVRKEWECDNQGRHTYVWGFDSAEKHRADSLCEHMQEFDHEFPLIDAMMDKQDVHGFCAKMGIKRPAMYDMGYNNNNCVGCIKGGMGYWNKIRVDFPEVFAARAKLERELGHSMLKECFLDELEPDRGRMDSEIMEECGIMCQLARNRV